MNEATTQAVWDFVASWRTLVVLAVLGVAPGVCTRLIVLAYPPGDERRDEIIGELYAVPFLLRPLWVAQHLERALSEGLPARRHNHSVRHYEDREESRRQDPLESAPPALEGRIRRAEAEYAAALGRWLGRLLIPVALLAIPEITVWVRGSWMRGAGLLGALLAAPVIVRWTALRLEAASVQITIIMKPNSEGGSGGEPEV